MKVKNLRGINELIDHMRRGDQIYQEVNGELFPLTKENILRAEFGRLLYLLDNSVIFTDNEEPFTLESENNIVYEYSKN